MRDIFISIAPNYGARAGHWTPIQNELMKASGKLNLNGFIISNAGVFNYEKPSLRLIDQCNSWREGLHTFITNNSESSVKIFIFYYEAGLLSIKYFDSLATNNKNINFCINIFDIQYPTTTLFKRPKGFFLPWKIEKYLKKTLFKISEDWSQSGVNSYQGDVKINNSDIYYLKNRKQVKNLRILAETQARYDLLKKNLIPVDDVWGGISCCPPPISVFRNRGSKFKILIPISYSQIFDWSLVNLWVLFFLMPFSLIGLCKVRIAFSGEVKLITARIFIYLLELSRFEIGSSPASYSKYGEMFVEFDAVLFPYNSFYIWHSSGKVLDALINLTPVIGLKKGYAEYHMKKWFKCAPSYSNPFNLITTILFYKKNIKKIKKELINQQEDISYQYSAECVIKKIFSLWHDADTKVFS